MGDLEWGESAADSLQNRRAAPRVSGFHGCGRRNFCSRAAPRFHSSPGRDFSCGVKLWGWLPVLFCTSQADSPSTTSFLQTRLKPCEAFSFLFIIFNGQCYGISRSLVQGDNVPLAGRRALGRSSVQPRAEPGHCPPWVPTGWASWSCEDIG